MSRRAYRPVRSSNIAGVDYDPDTSDLYVKFVNGTEYVYHNVLADDFDGLLTSGSPGSFFADNIKDQYPYERV